MAAEVDLIVMEIEEGGLRFGPIERAPRLADVVAETLLETILDREMRPGDPLAAERELAEQFGVSRPVVREALRSLAAKGVILVRQSASAVVATVDPSVVSAAMSLYLRTAAQVPYDQIHEVRVALEPAAAALAALRAGPTDKAALRATYERLARAAKRLIAAPDRLDPDLINTCALLDFEFHMEIARATQNQVFVITMDSIRTAQVQMRRIAMRKPGDAESVPEHEPIMTAIERGDADAARETMLAHLSSADDLWARHRTPVPLAE